jgi:hypothetical protein
MIILPAAIAAIASSMRAKGPGCLRAPFAIWICLFISQPAKGLALHPTIIFDGVGSECTSIVLDRIAFTISVSVSVRV